MSFLYYYSAPFCSSIVLYCKEGLCLSVSVTVHEYSFCYYILDLAHSVSLLQAPLRLTWDSAIIKSVV